MSTPVAAFAPRPPPLPPSPRPHTPPTLATDSLPPPLPPKLPPPPPPAPATASTTFPPSPSSFVVPVSATTPSSSAAAGPSSSPARAPQRTLRHRPSFDASTPSHNMLSHPKSRTTSIDLGYERFELGDPLLSARTDKDLPFVAGEDADDAEGEEEEEEADGLLGRQRRRRRPHANGSGNGPGKDRAAKRRRTLRCVLVAAALLATLLVLSASFAPARLVPSAAAGLGEKMRKAAQGVREKLGLNLVGGGKEGGGKGWEGWVAKEDEEGGDGDWVTLSNGTQVVYRNAFGGRFASSPYSYAARAQRDAPPLSEEWDFEHGRMRGVNLGGWLTLEPFITPSLFEPYLNDPEPAVDEWTLSLALRRRGGQAELERVLRAHYETFITELDFIAIAAAGLTWIRLPVPYWAISTWTVAGEERVDEPFLEGVAWEYVLRCTRWAQKYGLRLNLDLHSVPGSQNGWNHSGRLGAIGVLHGAMGLANAQRALGYVGEVARWCSREEIKRVVPMYSLLNEPMLAVIGPDGLRSFYAEAYETVRNITGYGRGNGPFLALHDGFKGTRRWYSFLEARLDGSSGAPHSRASATSRGSTNGLDRVALDSHRYLAFAEPDLRGVREQVMKACIKWAPEYNKTAQSFGIAISGEWALAVNDCGRFLNNVFQGTRLEGTFPNATTPMYPPSAPQGACDFWEDYEGWTDEFKAALRDLARAQMDTFQNWFYWTWKTTPSLLTPSRPANPLWSYSLGLTEGWIPRDPSTSTNFCFTYPSSPLSTSPELPKRVPLGPLEPWKIGAAVYPDAGGGDQGGTPEKGDVVGRVSDATREREGTPWPPERFDAPGGEYGNGEVDVGRLPRYEKSARGWVLPGLNDEQGRVRPYRAEEEAEKWYAPIEGCEYPFDAWETEGWEPSGGGEWCPSLSRAGGGDA
ncbi:hypothetical protein JCM10207_009231 [Rhodosporidiobolus poonsookiae]